MKKQYHHTPKDITNANIINKMDKCIKKRNVTNIPISKKEKIIDKTLSKLDKLKKQLQQGNTKTKNLMDIKSEIIHHWSKYQPDSKKSSLGKYYTPYHLTKLVKDTVKPFLSKSVKILDSCSGYGAFIETFKEYDIYGADIDHEAVEISNLIGHKNIIQTNSLNNSTRSKFLIGENDKLIIVGNPPYNDTTSKHKKSGTNAKKQHETKIDPSLMARDMGMSFMKHYATLEPEYICILHPFSYISKKTNFLQLSSFFTKYRLQKGIIFSSKEFGKNISGKIEFPVICALYTKGEMSFADIRIFSFEILGSNSKFIINKLTTIDDYGIRKYPNINPSNIGLYHYNIRDTNSLKTSGSLSTKQTKNHIAINAENFYQYAYLNCYRRYCNSNFLFGNTSPLCNFISMEDQNFRNYCIMDTIINNQRLWMLDLTNKESFLYIQRVLDTIKSNSSQDHLYQIFNEYIMTGSTINKNQFKEFFIEYFNTLMQSALSNQN